MDEELLRRFEALGIHRGFPLKGNTENHTPCITQNIETAFPTGKYLAECLRSVFTLDHVYRTGYLHGKILLETNPEAPIYAGFINSASNVSHNQLLFLDVETSSLNPGSGTLVFLVGLGYWTSEGYHTHQVFLNEPGDELSFLAYLDDWLSRYPVLVTFNGQAFDLPILNQRFLVNGIRSNILKRPHLDVLTLARRLWRKRYPSRRLAFLEQVVLGFTRSEVEIPSWMVPEIYLNYLRKGEIQYLPGVFYHNEMDILSLAGLFLYIENLLHHPLNWNSLSAGEIYGLITEMERQNRDKENLIAFLITMLKDFEDQRSETSESAQLWLTAGQIFKRYGMYSQALACWEKAAQMDSIDACLELSRHCERNQHDLVNALAWVDRAIKILDAHPSPAHKGRFTTLSQRRLRLLTLIGKGRQSNAT
ncbi:MAG: ribonuclease H-like domain-containing protein [Thermanaerothrix sp.]|nr:ribonuclease H-like domain-containing protein [Thermanaerothrix sp.]